MTRKLMYNVASGVMFKLVPSRHVTEEARMNALLESSRGGEAVGDVVECAPAEVVTDVWWEVT